jgi:D-alanyl-D-alanine carboxypeptidase
MRALVGGKGLNGDFQKQWLEALEAPVPGEASMQKYGYGILTISWGGNVVYYHEGEMPGYQSFMSYDPANDMTLVIWTNLTLALDGLPTANTLMVKILDEIYTTSITEAAK